MSDTKPATPPHRPYGSNLDIAINIAGVFVIAGALLVCDGIKRVVRVFRKEELKL